MVICRLLIFGRTSLQCSDIVILLCLQRPKEIMKNKTVAKIKQGMVIKREELGDKIGHDDDFELTEVFCGRSATKQEVSESWVEDNNEWMDLDDLNESVEHQQDIEIKQENCKMDMEALLPN